MDVVNGLNEAVLGFFFSFFLSLDGKHKEDRAV